MGLGFKVLENSEIFDSDDFILVFDVYSVNGMTVISD